MKSMGTSENKELSQESTSEQARSKLSGKGLALAALICVIAIALTALAVINNPGLSTIADNPNPMASGEVDVGDIIKDEIGWGRIDGEEELCGSDKVAFYATEGGTLTHDPNDDPNAPVKEIAIDDSAPVRLFGSSGIQTGLKEYVTTIAVTPYAHDGSITAVPDPGYSFVGWDNGKNTNPKWYIRGACGRYTMTAYFEKTSSENGIPELITPPEPDINGDADSSNGSDAIKDSASDGSNLTPPAMIVYAKNALDGNVALAQGKSVSLNGCAVLAGNYYAGKITGKVKYATSNAGIATVSDSGKVTASKKKTGTAKITLSSVENPNCKKVVTVKVVKKSKYKAVKAINKVNLKKQYKANVAKQIAVKVTSWNPKAPSNKDYVVTVSPASKASIDPATNKITFKAKGTVKVTVKSAENPKAKKTVSVKVN